MDSDPRQDATTIITEICERVERACRYSKLGDEETNTEAMLDRDVVLRLYSYYKTCGNNNVEAGRLARVQAIKIILSEIFA